MIPRTILVVLALAAAARAFPGGPDVPMKPGESIHRLKLHGSGADHINYLLSLPQAYVRDTRARFPSWFFSTAPSRGETTRRS